MKESPSLAREAAQGIGSKMGKHPFVLSTHTGTTCLNLAPGALSCPFVEETFDIWIGRWSKANGSPQCRGASSNWLRTRKEQKGWTFCELVGNPSWLTALSWEAGFFLPSDLNWNVASSWVLSLLGFGSNLHSHGCQAFGLRQALYHWPSWQSPQSWESVKINTYILRIINYIYIFSYFISSVSLENLVQG